MSEPHSPDAVTLARAGRFLGLSIRQVQRLIAQGKLVVYRYSRHATRVDVRSLQAYRATKAENLPRP